MFFLTQTWFNKFLKCDSSRLILLFSPQLSETATSRNTNPTQHSSGRQRPSNSLSSRRSLGLRLHTEPGVVPDPPQEQRNITDDHQDQKPHDPHERCHPSVLTDRSVPLPNHVMTSGVAVEESVVQTAAAEETNTSLHKSVETDNIFCRDERVQTGSSEIHAAATQWVTSTSDLCSPDSSELPPWLSISVMINNSSSV